MEINILTEIADRGTLTISDHARLLRVIAKLKQSVICEADPIGYLMYDAATCSVEYTEDSRLAGAVGSTCAVYAIKKEKPFYIHPWI
jgi:hypothetical protein